MTVRCIPDFDKRYYAKCFISKAMTINEIAVETGTSRRTVIRMLEEQGVDPGIKRRPRKQKQEVQQQLPIQYAEEEPLTFWQKIKCFFLGAEAVV